MQLIYLFKLRKEMFRLFVTNYIFLFKFNLISMLAQNLKNQGSNVMTLMVMANGNHFTACLVFGVGGRVHRYIRAQVKHFTALVPRMRNPVLYFFTLTLSARIFL